MRLPAPLIRSLMAETGMKEIAHYLRASHLQFLANILEDPEASDNDKFVATNLLKNSCVAAEGKLPTCQAWLVLSLDSVGYRYRHQHG